MSTVASSPSGAYERSDFRALHASVIAVGRGLALGLDFCESRIALDCKKWLEAGAVPGAAEENPASKKNAAVNDLAVPKDGVSRRLR